MILIAEVIIDIQNKQINKTFDYIVPSYLEDIIDIGLRVKVPFGNTLRVAYVINLKNETDVVRLKEIIEIVDVVPILNKEFIEIAKYISSNYFTYYATILDAMIPKSLKIKYKKVAKLLTDNPNDELKNLFKRKEIIIDNLSNENQKIIFKAYKNNLVSIETKIADIKDDRPKLIRLLNPSYKTRSIKIKNLIKYLEEAKDPVDYNSILSDFSFTKSKIEELVNEKVIEILISDNKKEIVYHENKMLPLSTDQQKVFDKLNFDEYKTYLLHGITGSGKTLLYLYWINEVVKKGKRAILLVPEISLTPQVTQILYDTFKENIAVLHSRLTPKEKYDEWKRIINHEIKIVVGARSAIFSKLDDLGLIIIDEAHDQSYIQQSNPRYDTIDVAKFRAKYHNVPLILGTATPKVSDYYYATNQEYELLELKNRANNKDLPKSIVVDLREELKHGNKTPISYLLQKNLKRIYDNNEQAILFLNRRGFNTFVMCRNCGEVIKCPHCDVSLTYHQKTNILKCHHCGFQTTNITECPNCGSNKIRYVGTGTEKIYEEVKKILPEANVIRVDFDTIKSMDDVNDYYNKFKNHEADILIGTQMITKGLDFKDVTLVGILNADLALNFPSYDANQIAFNLIEQASGRSGRSDKEGLVIIQSYNPDHYVIQSAKIHDYELFYNKEIKNRYIQNMPPFSTYLKLTISSADKKKAFADSIIIANALKNCSNESKILGPTEDYIFKKNDIYYYVINVIAKEDSVLECIKELYPSYQTNKDVNLDIEKE